jgi:hypothetical protein
MTGKPKVGLVNTHGHKYIIRPKILQQHDYGNGFNTHFVGFVVFTAVSIKLGVFWVVVSCTG